MKRAKGRRIACAIGLALALAMLAPTVLMLAYKVVAPVSTPMLARWAALQPVTRDWRGLDEIAPDVVRAVIMSEDGQYCIHEGVNWAELRALMREAGGPSRGGSTIAMQTARNLFLWRGASYVRKALEIPLALMLDRVLGKRRLMEIYLNVAEWDEGGVFGIEAGAQAQFGVDAAALTRAQAARMAAVLPNPIVFDARSGRRTARISALIERRVVDSDVWTACVL